MSNSTATALLKWTIVPRNLVSMKSNGRQKRVILVSFVVDNNNNNNNRSRRGCIRCTTTTPSSTSTTTYPLDDVGGSLFDCVIVGGGISGLCIAQALSTKHPSVSPNIIVTESNSRVGGNINTVEAHGHLWEEGPNSFQPSDAMLTMAVDSGLKDDLVLADPDSPRFVYWKGKLRPVPSKPTDLPFFDLLSFPGKLRAAFGALGFRPSPPPHEESVESFVRRNLGDQVFERLIEPFCSGVYAGDPSKLSMKAAFGRVWKLEQKGGTIIGGTLKAIQERKNAPQSPRDPYLLPSSLLYLHTIYTFVSHFLSFLAASPNPRAKQLHPFAEDLPHCLLPLLIGDKVKLSWKLSTIDKQLSGDYSLTYETPEGVVTLRSKSVVMTVPSYVASGLLRPLSDTAADALSKFHYPPVAAVSLSYPKEAIRPDCLVNGELKGFGQLHPRSQGVETLGTIYSSSLFPARAPSDRNLLLSYIGGATNPGILHKTQNELAETVDKDLRKMLINPNAKDPLVLGVRVWPKAIPQFLIGHSDLLDAAKTALFDAGFKGLFLGGNYVSGVALGRCVEGAYEAAAEVADFLSQYADK